MKKLYSNLTYDEAISKISSTNYIFDKCVNVFQLNCGVFAHRKSWSSSTLSVFNSRILPSWNKAMCGQKGGLILTGNKIGEWNYFSPTEEDLKANDWEVLEMPDEPKQYSISFEK